MTRRAPRSSRARVLSWSTVEVRAAVAVGFTASTIANGTPGIVPDRVPGRKKSREILVPVRRVDKAVAPHEKPSDLGTGPNRERNRELERERRDRSRDRPGQRDEGVPDRREPGWALSPVRRAMRRKRSERPPLGARRERPRSDGGCGVVDELVDVGGERTRVHERSDLSQSAPPVPRRPGLRVDRRLPTPIRPLPPSRTTLIDHTETLRPHLTTARPATEIIVAILPTREAQPPSRPHPVRSTDERPREWAQTCSHAASPSRHSPAVEAVPRRGNGSRRLVSSGAARAPTLAARGWAPAPAFGRVGHGGPHQRDDRRDESPGTRTATPAGTRPGPGQRPGPCPGRATRAGTDSGTNSGTSMRDEVTPTALSSDPGCDLASDSASDLTEESRISARDRGDRAA